MSNVDRSFKVQFSGSNNLYNNLKFTKTSNQLNSKAKLVSFETNNNLEVHFNSSTNNLNSKANLNDISRTFIPEAKVTPTEEDIYYDEIIYYDGGGVDGWLLEDDM